MLIMQKSKRLTSKLESEIREAVALRAINGVLSIPALLRTHLGVEKLSQVAGESDPVITDQ